LGPGGLRPIFELVSFKPYIWLRRGLTSLAGRGLTERIRATGFALLGLTAAGGLALVAIFAQPGWPLLEQAPLPNAPEHAVSQGVALHSDDRASGPTVAGAPSSVGSEATGGPGAVISGGSEAVDGGGSPAGAIAVGGPRALIPPAGNSGGDQPGGGSTPSPAPESAPVPAPAPVPTTTPPAPEFGSPGSGHSTAGTPGEKGEEPEVEVSPPEKPHGSGSISHGHGTGGSSGKDESSGDSGKPPASEPPPVSYEVAPPSESNSGKGSIGGDSTSGDSGKTSRETGK
jgi:hypothetical protein